MKKTVFLLVAALLGRTPAYGQRFVPPVPAHETGGAPAPAGCGPSIEPSCGSSHRCCPIGGFFKNLFAHRRLNCCGRFVTSDELGPMPAGNLSPAEIAAAKIRVDQAGAGARLAAIRYLGTVDCHWYPEAEAALIAGLRADRNEAVRFEAALALANGCCRTRSIVDHLSLVVSAGDKDGNPPENSERVKAMAGIALNNCLQNLPSLAEPPLARPTSAPGQPAPLTLTLTNSLTTSEPRSGADLVPASLAERVRAETLGVSSLRTPGPLTSRRNLYRLWAKTSGPRPIPELPVQSTSAAPTSFRTSGLAPIGLIPGQ